MVTKNIIIDALCMYIIKITQLLQRIFHIQLFWSSLHDLYTLANIMAHEKTQIKHLSETITCTNRNSSVYLSTIYFSIKCNRLQASTIKRDTY